MSGYGRAVVLAVIAVALGLFACAAVIVLVVGGSLGSEGWLVVALAVGLLSYGLRVLTGVAPWDDLREALAHLLRSPGNGRGGGGGSGGGSGSGSGSGGGGA